MVSIIDKLNKIEHGLLDQIEGKEVNNSRIGEVLVLIELVERIKRIIKDDCCI